MRVLLTILPRYRAYIICLSISSLETFNLRVGAGSLSYGVFAEFALRKETNSGV